jgi:ABC-type transport system involved in multi-copper enzyme maturation permease subunit
MIWLTWRQFRPQWLSAMGAGLVLAAATLTLGVLLRHAYATLIVACARSATCGGGQITFTQDYLLPVRLLGLLLQVTPALIGLFWGAPLIARELETGSFRLVWTQSATRNHWLAAKLAVLALASGVVTGLFSLFLTWAARPMDHFSGDRFAKLVFPARDVVPVGYAVFAFVLGCTLGLLARRTVPAMVLTLVVFAAVQLAMPIGVRGHLLPPQTRLVPVTTSALSQTQGMFVSDSEAVVEDYVVPGAWMLSATHTILTSQGRPADPAVVQACMTQGDAAAAAVGGRPGPVAAGPCLSRLDLHFDVSYQPANRYWALQLLETAIFLGLAAVLAGICFWRIPRARA